ncbi:MAG: ferrochelatase [Candidatus Hydrogenedentes bacterium]|nr:ferrochelatase [Candidatus Hydrogenedentota bacterium]
MHPDGSLGILLVNTGTTAAPRVAETRAYLREFLSDPRVLDMPALWRWLLLHGVILRFRPQRSAEAYSKIWTPAGSPLLTISRAFQHALQERMPEAVVELAMRYGAPSIADGLRNIVAKHATRIVVAPLFPQYASATTGSILERVYAEAGRLWNVPALTMLPPFYSEPGFLDAWQAVSQPVLESFRPDFVLFSYHGLPERQVRKSDPSGGHCLVKPDCCEVIGPVNQYCYRAQCLATTRALTVRLGLKPNSFATSFQSRLGRDPWLEPATDKFISELPGKGVRRLAVLCPAFVADCLETLEEIGLRARDTFLHAGGEAFQLVPSLNDHPAWVNALANLLSQQSSTPVPDYGAR